MARNKRHDHKARAQARSPLGYENGGCQMRQAGDPLLGRHGGGVAWRQKPLKQLTLGHAYSYPLQTACPSSVNRVAVASGWFSHTLVISLLLCFTM